MRGFAHLNKNSRKGDKAVGQHRSCSRTFQAEEKQGGTRHRSRNKHSEPTGERKSLAPLDFCSNVIL